MISTNPGEPVKPLSKIASGGELSRIMLAIKNVLTQTEDVGTLIFDEIDTGVSGRAAQKIALKLGEISRRKQTLCVTHLPQLAAMGDHHLLIKKSLSEEYTFTDVFSLTEEERVSELRACCPVTPSRSSPCKTPRSYWNVRRQTRKSNRIIGLLIKTERDSKRCHKFTKNFRHAA